MPASKREQILCALETRLGAITRRAGSSTDAGRTIYINETPELSEDDPDAIAVMPQEDEVQFQQAKVLVTLPIEIHALVSIDGGNTRSWMKVEALIADIKRAVELEDRTLGGVLPHPLQFQRGVTKTLEREDGSNTIGASVTYLATIVEEWGAP